MLKSGVYEVSEAVNILRQSIRVDSQGEGIDDSSGKSILHTTFHCSSSVWAFTNDDLLLIAFLCAVVTPSTS